MAHAEAAGCPIRITVVRSLVARQLESVQLSLPMGATVAQALIQSGWWTADSPASTTCVGVWGKPKSLDHLLRDLDRVELYRPLRVDPKQARRERQARQTLRK
jgi:putative ubiquitin-RnfH superfamily antitoxin RatB of RatAB toxin-antitoxin module